MFRSETTIKATRKARPCDFCGCTIEKGSPAVKLVGKFDGFFEDYGHADCLAFWEAAYPIYADQDEGMVHDLAEAIGGDEGRDVLLHELSIWRGKFPHVVTRIESRLQLSDIRWADRLRANGREPDPEDCEPIYA